MQIGFNSIRQAGMTRVQAVLAPNPGAAKREGTLTFQTQGTEKSLTFTQAGARLTFPQGPFAFGPQALTDQAIAGDQGQSAVSNSNGLAWTAQVTQGEEWLSCKASGTSGEVLTVTLLANEGSQVREGKITLQSGELTQVLTLSQASGASSVSIVSGSGAGNPATQMENDFKGFSQPAGLRVKSPHAWTASVSAAWITLTTTSGAANEAEGVALNFTAKPNPTGTAREALITVDDGRGESGSVKTFKVTQKANPIPTLVPNGYTGEVPVLVATGGLQADGKLPSGANSLSRLYFTLTPDLTPSFSRSYYEVQSYRLNTADKVITFRKNTTSNDVSVTLKVTYNGYTFSWTITQSRG